MNDLDNFYIEISEKLDYDRNNCCIAAGVWLRQCVRAGSISRADAYSAVVDSNLCPMAAASYLD